MFASWYNPNPEVVQTLLRAGADPRAQDHTDETALMLAARYGNSSEDLAMLLEAGADAKAKDKLGMTALDYAKANEKLRGTAGFRCSRRVLGNSAEHSSRATLPTRG